MIQKLNSLYGLLKKNLRGLLDGVQMKIGNSVIELNRCVKLLGVILCRSANFYLYQIGKIRHNLTESAVISAVRTLILSRFDYCNSLLYGITSSRLNKVQLVQNSAARLVMKKSKREHISPLLVHLHWLPVRARVEYKVALVAHKCFYQPVPRYLQDTLSWYVPGRSLRSSEQHLAKPVKGKKKIGGCGLSSSGPRVWNELPECLRAIATLDHFKAQLKTHLFRKFLS